MVHKISGVKVYGPGMLTTLTCHGKNPLSPLRNLSCSLLFPVHYSFKINFFSPKVYLLFGSWTSLQQIFFWRSPGCEAVPTTVGKTEKTLAFLGLIIQWQNNLSIPRYRPSSGFLVYPGLAFGYMRQKHPKLVRFIKTWHNHPEIPTSHSSPPFLFRLRFCAKNTSS